MSRAYIGYDTTVLLKKLKPAKLGSARRRQMVSQMTTTQPP